MEPLAEKIRTNPQIEGIHLGKEVHTITLFADDVFLSQSNLAISLKAVHDVLEMFIALSYYKINASKLSIAVDSGMKTNSEFPAIHMGKRFY